MYKVPKNVKTRFNNRAFALRFLEAIGSPFALSQHIRLTNGMYLDVATASVSPSAYNDPLNFFLDYQASKLLSKDPCLPTGVNRVKVAEAKFLEAEKQCMATNERFRNGSITTDPVVARVLSDARQHIANVLGDVPAYSDLDFRFGPGASLGTRGDTSYYKKLSGGLESTYTLAHLLPDFLSEFPGWLTEGTHEVELVRGSELTFVPKDCKTDRAICIEPLLNGLYQKGFGAYIRDRLARVGINIRDQRINQRLAQKAYALGLATVDFSMASDTISYLLVLDLLPIDWFLALEAGRSPSFTYEGGWYPFQKFSSMGNAYTFELETLIFYALARACMNELGLEVDVGGNLHVYGDDVILPSSAFELYGRVMGEVGFTVNVSKSFGSGAFYESCGNDFFQGCYVRPVQIKKDLGTGLSPIYWAANAVQKTWQTASALNAPEPLLGALARLWDWVVGCIPRRLRFFGPGGKGEGVLVVPIDRALYEGSVLAPARLPSGEVRGWEGWYIKSLVERPREIRLSKHDTPYVLYSAMGICDGSTIAASRGYSLRGETVTHVTRIFVNEWTSEVTDEDL